MRVSVITMWTTASSQVVMFFLHSVALLWPSEWEVISKLFIVDQASSLHCSGPGTATGTTPQYTTQPGKYSVGYIGPIQINMSKEVILPVWLVLADPSEVQCVLTFLNHFYVR